MSLATRRRNALPVAAEVSSLRTCPSLSSESYWQARFASPFRWSLVSRGIASGTQSGVAQTNWACFGPGAVRSPGVQSSLSVDCRQEPARAALTIELASPGRCPVLFPRRHGFTPFRPFVGCAPKEEGENPRAVNQIGTRPPGRWCNARSSTAPAPQSKPVTPAPLASWRRLRRRWHPGLG
jgi:hypothetical protein